MTSKRMTANPIRPARHRPGKPGATVEDTSSDDEPSENENVDEQLTTNPKQLAAPRTAASYPRATSQIASGLKGVNIADRKPIDTAVEDESDEESERGSEEDSEEESGSSEESEDQSSSEDEVAKRRMLRPVFIKKNARNSTTTVDTKSEEQRIAEDEVQRKVRQDEMIQKELEKKAQAKAEERVFWDDDKVVDDVDDTDGLDVEAEYMAWTIRALKRQKRDEDDRLRSEKEREEVERWRNLPADQREAEIEERLRKQKEDKDSRGKMGFMQKYHHGGAFYKESLEDAGLANRDIMGGRYEDEIQDRSVLPQFMQIRDMTKLGRKGRTRYRDLKSEDTGRFGEFQDKRRVKGDFDLDNRFRPDTLDREGATGANASLLGERRRLESNDQREHKRQKID